MTSHKAQKKLNKRSINQVAIEMPPSTEVPCGLCKRPVREREKAKNAISCKKCGQVYHLKCSGLDSKKHSEIVSANAPWICASCKRLSLNKGTIPRTNSVSDECLGGNPRAETAADDILAELDQMSGRLGKIRAAAVAAENAGKSGDIVKEKACENEDKWKEIEEKIDAMRHEIEAIKVIVNGQNEKITQLEEALEQQGSENEKLKAELVSVKISVEADKQRGRSGDIIICGLPVQLKVNAEDVFSKLCTKLEIDCSANTKNSPKFKVWKVQNRAVEEQRLEIQNVNPSLSSLIIKKYRQARRDKVSFTSGDLVSGGDSKPIYVNESLTGYFQLLFKKARDLRRKGNIKFVWTNEGMVYARKEEKSKIFRIKHHNDLERFN